MILPTAIISQAVSGGRKPLTTNVWSALPLAEWKDTYDTLHILTQIVGKIRLASTPLVKHWWNVTLYVTPRGLTTSTMFYNGLFFQIDFDFIAHRVLIETTECSAKTIALQPRSVDEFYQDTMTALASLGIPVNIWSTPVEVSDRTPFEQDQLPMIPKMRSGSGAFWRRLAGYLWSFVPDSQAR
jgi:hypothetical protein